jgi:hypothetical protein
VNTHLSLSVQIYSYSVDKYSMVEEGLDEKVEKDGII